VNHLALPLKNLVR